MCFDNVHALTAEFPISLYHTFYLYILFPSPLLKWNSLCLFYSNYLKGHIKCTTVNIKTAHRIRGRYCGNYRVSVFLCDLCTQCPKRGGGVHVYRSFFYIFPLINRSRESWVGIASGRPGFDSRQGQDIFIYAASRPAMRPTEPPIQWVRRSSFLWAKAAGVSSWSLISS
jgi:hypothetical protein